MKRIALAAFGSVLIWAVLVTWLTNAYLGGNMFLGALIVILGGAVIGCVVVLLLMRGVLKKPAEMSKETTGILTILIAEIQDCKDMEKVKSLLDCWIKANDLHPESVKKLSKDELLAMLSTKKA